MRRIKEFTSVELEEMARKFLESQEGYQDNVDWIEQPLDDLVKNLAVFMAELLSME